MHPVLTRTRLAVDPVAPQIKWRAAGKTGRWFEFVCGKEVVGHVLHAWYTVCCCL